MSRFALAVLLVTTLPAAALALATEHYGNAPINPDQWNLPAGVADVVNNPGRDYWYEVNGWPVFFCRGDATALNAARAKFAALKTEHKQIRFQAGPGETKNLLRTKTIAFDWSVSIPGGFTRIGAAEPVVMTVHVTVPKPTAEPDAAIVKLLIGDLDSPTFTVRVTATKKLRDYGFAGVPFYRAALKTTESAEARSRLEDLLDRLKGIDVLRLDLPAGVTVLGPKDLSEQYRGQLADANAETRGRAVYGFATHQVDRANIVKVLEQLLDKETDAYTLGCVARTAEELGADAKPLLPALRKQIAAPNVNVKTAFAAAVKTIEAAKATPRPTGEAELWADVQTAVTAARTTAKPTK